MTFTDPLSISGWRGIRPGALFELGSDKGHLWEGTEQQYVFSPRSSLNGWHLKQIEVVARMQRSGGGGGWWLQQGCWDICRRLHNQNSKLHFFVTEKTETKLCPEDLMSTARKVMEKWCLTHS
jgi:hypothetical protein